MAEDQNKNTVDDTTKTTEYEDVCYICRRPESVAGKMIHIQDNICICNDCMQKTFDTMNTGGFNMGDIMNMNNGKMPNISMIRSHIWIHSGTILALAYSDASSYIHFSSNSVLT